MKVENMSVKNLQKFVDLYELLPLVRFIYSHKFYTKCCMSLFEKTLYSDVMLKYGYFTFVDRWGTLIGFKEWREKNDIA